MSVMGKGPHPANLGPNKAASRPRSMTQWIWLAMLATNLLALFAAVVISRKVRSLTLPTEQEPIWIGVGYALILAAAVADAFWADELFFRGAFRKFSMGGKTLAHAQRDGDAEAITATMRPMHLIFPVLVLAGLALSYLSANLISRSFYSDYDRIGAHALEIRKTQAADSNKRKESIEALSMVQRPRVQLFLARQLQHPDEETAAFSAWALGRLRDKNLRRMFTDDLMRAARGTKPLLAKEAQLALARMQHRPVAAMLENRVRRALEHIGDPLDPRLIWSLGFTQQETSIPLLSKALYHPDSKVRRIAAWSLGQQKGPKNAERALAVLSERLPSAPLPTRCAIVHAMGILGHERANLDIVQALKTASPEERARYCETEALALRPDGKGLDRHKLLLTPVKNTVETFEVMSLFSMGAIRATDPEIKRVVLGMLDELLERKDAPQRTKDAANSLKDGINRG